jgi:hypothetical protein
MTFKRSIVLFGLLVAALAFAAVGSAHPRDGKPGGHHWKKHHRNWHGKHWKGHFAKKGPYTVVTTDNGSCGTAWATDTVKRTFFVRKKRDGSYRVWRFDRGEFLTLEARSPGACDTDGRHGSVVHAGARGRMHGYLVGTVPSTFTFNKDAVCPVDCGFTDVFLNTHFGPGASDQFSCFTNSTDCRFAFKYHAFHGQGLVFHRWKDAGHGAGTFLHERFQGDIAHA